MKKVAVIHGTKGSPIGNWYPWIARELEARGHTVIIPRMPTPEGQDLESWLREFYAAVGAPDSSTMLIGHSAGAVLILRILEQLARPVFGSAFIAGFTGNLNREEYDALNASFLREPFNWTTIKRNAGSVLCFIGEDDPYVPREQGDQIAGGLHCKARLIPRGGHLNSEAGYTTFPELLTDLVNIGL